MKHFYKLFKATALALLLQLTTLYVKAQTTLAPGDIAFIGFQTGGAPATQDGFSFITLKDIAQNTKIYFTEKGWGGTTWVTGSTETHLLWTVPAFTPAGTIVSIVETATADVFTVTGTTGTSITFALGSGFNLSGGDQMLAYQSSTGAEPTSPTFIAGVHADYNSTDYDPATTWNTAWNGTTGASGGNESALPTGLTNGVNCVSLFPAPGPEIANSKYTGTLTGTPAALSTAINTPANWAHHATDDLGITPSGYPTPSLSAPTTTINSITRASANPTLQANVSYVVTFGASVTNVTTSNFSITTTGSISGVAVSGISGSGTTRTVTVNTGSGSGTLRLNFANATGISPGISTTLPFNGETYTIDRTAPSAPVVSSPSNGSTYANNKPAISGTAEANSTVTIIVDGGNVGTATANGSGSWTYAISTALADGSHTVRATATDALGNTSSSNTNTFVIDTQAPSAPVVSTPSNGSTSANNKPAISGTAEANSTVTIIVDGSNVGTTTATGSGNWTYAISTALANGSHNVRVTATDAAGNESASSNTNSFTINTTLPVNLIRFEATTENKIAKLQWQTASEQNNKGFEIYRSGDDKNFVKIGNVTGKGNSNTVNAYHYVDQQPLNGNNYYRLLQLDNNGVATILAEKALSFSLSVTGVSIYPNPVQQQLTVNFAAGSYQKLVLYGLDGRVLAQLALSAGQSTAVIAMHSYAKGLYIVKLVGLTKEEAVKVMKL